MRPRRINRSHNRAVLAARAGSATPSTEGVSRNPGARPSTVVPAGGNVRNRKAVRMTGAQVNSVGSKSEWSESPYFFTDPAWAYTVRSNTP